MPQHLADGLEDRSLDLLALGRRFDHEPTGRHADDAVDRLDPFERGVACLGVDLFLLDQPAELFAIPALPASARSLETSVRSTRYPACADNCAMPAPKIGRASCWERGCQYV